LIHCPGGTQPLDRQLRRLYSGLAAPYASSSPVASYRSRSSSFVRLTSTILHESAGRGESCVGVGLLGMRSDALPKRRTRRRQAGRASWHWLVGSIPPTALLTEPLGSTVTQLEHPEEPLVRRVRHAPVRRALTPTQRRCPPRSCRTGSPGTCTPSSSSAASPRSWSVQEGPRGRDQVPALMDETWVRSVNADSGRVRCDSSAWARPGRARARAPRRTSPSRRRRCSFPAEHVAQGAAKGARDAALSCLPCTSYRGPGPAAVVGDE
jgi:hypothetical protein